MILKMFYRVNYNTFQSVNTHPVLRAAQNSDLIVELDTYRVAGAVPSGLWQRHACRSTWKPA